MTIPSEPTPIAVAVVWHEGRVLIGRRLQGKALEGFWEFPGGKVSTGETPREAAARECREETGLAVCVGDRYLETVYDYEHGRVRLHFFAAVPVDPVETPREPFRWVRVSDLARYAFPPANGPLLDVLTVQTQPD
ncbi:MAG: (deoxy)nucleoside triphosphate pyrophosphohydrolase [Planctomycetota bacterium]|jgi:8-oxo-dGTP diphosphatase